jgi:NTE family protein
VSDRTGKGVVMIEAFNIMQDRLTRTAGDPPDVHITPHIGHIGWLDFHRAEEAIAAGNAATETALEPIEATIAALA